MSSLLKMESNLCRCCHEEGFFANLGHSFKCGTEEHSYSEMIKLCFNLQISPVEDAKSDITYTICTVCIESLRQAILFKRQIESCEDRLQSMLDQRNFIPNGDVEIVVKKEMSEDDNLADEDDKFLSFLRHKDDESDISDDTKPSDTLLELINSQHIHAAGLKVRKRVPIGNKCNATKKKKNRIAASEKVCAKRGRPRKGDSKPRKVTSAAKRNEKLAERKDKREVLAHFKNQYTIVSVGNKSKYMCRCGALIGGLDCFVTHLLRKHGEQKIKKCPCCDAQFKTYINKKRHLAEVHKLEESGWHKKTLKPVTETICTVCNKIFPSASLKDVHVNKSHTMRKCSQCSLMFNLKDMHAHKMKEHRDALPSCGVCGYKSDKHSCVLRHQRVVHLKEKNIKCEHCDLCFFDKGKLQRHMVVHNPERKYECKFCHKRFPRLNTMRLHEKIHTGEKNKVCKICGDKFVQKASLNYHMGKYHPEERF